MFLVLGILIVLFLVTIKLATAPAKIITRPNEFDTINIRNEFSNVQKYSSGYNTTITNIDNFTNFMVDRLSQRKIDLTGVYINGFIDNNNANIITITFGNYLSSNITYVNMSFGNSVSEQGTYVINFVNPRTYNSTNITFSTLAEQKHINVTYTTNGVNNTLFYTFTPKSNLNTISTIFDLKFSILDKITKDRFVQTDYL